MQIILNPNVEGKSLKDYYAEALMEGDEVLIVTAYLTNWNISNKLSRKCNEFCFVIGTDFGITKKTACFNVLKWLPDSFKNDFCAADFTTGFHPKVLIWHKLSGGYYAIIGSSNLTQAAFETNYEANVFLEIGYKEYRRLKQWIYGIKRLSTPISTDWIKNYNEISRNNSPKRATSNRVITFDLPRGKSIIEAINSRRLQQNSFLSIKRKLSSIINKCAFKEITNIDFYEELLKIWGQHRSRFQGQGFQIKGKNGNWQEICASLVKILNVHNNYGIVELDIIVKKEIDSLTRKSNPNRGAWFTEILCHYYPKYYPLVNKPIWTWLHFNKFRSPRNSSEGSKYIDLSLKLRQAIEESDNYPAKNLAELDGAIWQWYDNKYNSTV